jgi:hypothetical protein
MYQYFDLKNSLVVILTGLRTLWGGVKFPAEARYSFLFPSVQIGPGTYPALQSLDIGGKAVAD